MIIEIIYVDGTRERGSAAEWPKLRADGVDEVLVAALGWQPDQDEVQINSARLNYASLFWLYPDGEAWVIGCGCVGYGADYGDAGTVTEWIVTPLGEIVERRRRHMPDLTHDLVKLGAWRPGTGPGNLGPQRVLPRADRVVVER